MTRIIKVYDCHDGEEWVAAWSPRSALRFYLSETGVDFRFDMEGEMPIAVCDAEMERLQFIEDCDKPEQREKKSFKKKLAEMIAAKEKFPCWFAIADY